MLGGGTRGIHHLYTGAKGDPVCPLGFHPQVRWPTRCKRCLRDYKEHGGAKKDDSLRRDETTASSPSLSSSSSTSTSRYRDGLFSDAGSNKGWNSPSSSSRLPPGRTSASSWTSTPDLQSLSGDTTSKDTAITVVRLPLPSRKSSTSTSSSTQTHSAAKPPIPTSSSSTSSSSSSSAGTESELRRRYNERRRLSGEFDQTSSSSSSSLSSSSSKSSASDSSTPIRKRISVQEVKTIDSSTADSKKDSVNPDVEFIIRVKSSVSKSKRKSEKPSSGKESESEDDDSSIAASDTTSTTLVGGQGKSMNEEELESMRQELAELRTRCEKAEREKNDILLRRISAASTATSRTSSSELLRLQQKVNELNATKERLEQDKRSLNLKVDELSEELEKSKAKKKKKKKVSETSAAAVAIRRRRALLAGRTFSEEEEEDDEEDEQTKRTIEDLKNKLTAAEQLCEELMDENSEMKKEIREMEEEMEEMQDNFREDQVDEYTSLKKELEQTAKNCRILQFKLRKAERRAETLETERNEAVANFAAHSGSGVTEAQKKLEHDLSLANQVALRLQSEMETLQEKLKAKEAAEEGKKKSGLEKGEEVRKKAPKLAAIAKSSSGERPTRESLTRGGSQDDPVQLLRDLQDSMEREADLREQLRFAEEELRRRRSLIAPRLSCSTRSIQVLESELEPLSSLWMLESPPPLPPRQDRMPNPPRPPFSSCPKLIPKVVGPKNLHLQDSNIRDDVMAFLHKTERSNSNSLSQALSMPPGVSQNQHSAFENQNIFTNESCTQTFLTDTKDEGVNTILTNVQTNEFNTQTSSQSLIDNNCETHVKSIDSSEFGTQTTTTTMISEETQSETSAKNEETNDIDIQTSVTSFENNNFECAFRNITTNEFGVQKSFTDSEIYNLYNSIKTAVTNDFGIQTSPSISEMNLLITHEKIFTDDTGTQASLSNDVKCKFDSPIHIMITNDSSTQTSLIPEEPSNGVNNISTVVLASSVSNKDNGDITVMSSEDIFPQSVSPSASIPLDHQICQPTNKESTLLAPSPQLTSQSLLTSPTQPSPSLSDLSNSPSLTLPSLPSSGNASPEFEPTQLASLDQPSSSSNISTPPPSLISFLSPTPPSTPDLHSPKSISVGVQFPPDEDLKILDSSIKTPEIYNQINYSSSKAQNLRKKLSRVEDDNESLVAQLKRMAAKSRSTRKHSPSPARLTPEPSLEKDEGISEDDDPAELRLQLELNEQEAAVLRRKVEDLEREGETTKKQLKELQDKLAEKKTVTPPSATPDITSKKGNAISEQKIKVLEEEANELRKKLIEKERDCERLHAELTLTQKRSSKGLMQRSRSLDSGGGTGPIDQATFDLKRQLQVVEQEANILRTRTQELEAECERISAENKKLSLSKATTGKRTSELKTLRERVKQLEAKLESSETGKISTGELTKEGVGIEKKDADDNKDSSNIETMKIRLEKAEAEVEQLTSELKKVKDPKSMLLRKRTAKRPTDLTPKTQMKKMVEELEIEIAEILVVLKNTDAEKTKLSEELKKKEGVKKDTVDKDKAEWEKDKAEKEKLAKELAETKVQLAEVEKEKKKIQAEKAGAEEETKKKKDEEIRMLKESKSKAEEERKKLEKEKSELQDEMKKLKTEKDESSSKWEDDLRTMTERMDDLRKEVEKERSTNDDVKVKLDEVKSEAQKDKNRLEKEVNEKTKKFAELEKKAKETEEKLKKTERFLSNKKEKVTKLEKEVQDEREKMKQLEERQKEVSVGWLKEREELKKVSEESQIKVAELEAQVQLLESSVKDEQKKTQELQQKVGHSEKENQVIKGLQDELNALKKQFEEANQKLEKSEKLRKTNEDKLKKAEAEIKKDKGKAKEDHLKEIEKLEQELTNERQAYEDLTSKYEMLEEDYVVTKAQLVSEKEETESQLLVAKHEMDSLDEELETLRESFNSKQDAWIKEKVDLQERLKEAEEKASRAANNNETWTVEKKKLRGSLEEKTNEAEQLRREAEVISDQIDHLRKENEELKGKLEDFDKVSKIQRSMAADTSALEKQLQEIKNTLNLEEKNHKAEVSTLRMRYENRISLLSQELESSQNTAARFRRERDAQRHLLEAAQKSMSELRKSAAGKAKGLEPTAEDMADDVTCRLATLEQEVACLEDELSEARLDKSRLKTELVNERSAWEVKIAEMQSRVNELEEERILTTGRKGIIGVRTRMELAWHKEREEQHRLLQETTTLARDLRQTLFEVERERDKERLEAKRKAEQLKRSMEEEQEENRKKLAEMQNDLLELRDAHAKLRTTNEKLRRDRERLQERIEKEREESKTGMAVRKKKKAEEESKVAALLEQVDSLMKLAPELFPPQQQKTVKGKDTLSLPSSLLTTAAPTTPHVPKRTKGPRSRENSPLLERKELKREGSLTSLSGEEEKRGHQLQWALQRLTEATEELRRSHQHALEEDRHEKDGTISRRGLGIRRAASTESEPDDSVHMKSSTLSRLGGAGSAVKKKGSLYRKSISLEQTGGHPVGSASEQSIWKTDGDGSTSSLQSIEAGSEIMEDRYPSLDRLSAGSTQSELGTTKKKKTGIFGKLKKLTKSKSIDESNIHDYDGSTQGGSVISSGSEISVGVDMPEERGRAKDLKGKLSGLFKKSGSRSSSMDRGSSEKVSSAASEHGASSTQRPLSRTDRNVLSRPSPARSDSSHTSSTSRPLAANTTTKAVINRK